MCCFFKINDDDNHHDRRLLSSDEVYRVLRWHDDTARRRSPTSRRTRRRRCRRRTVHRASHRGLLSSRTGTRSEPGAGRATPGPSRRPDERRSELLTRYRRHDRARRCWSRRRRRRRRRWNQSRGRSTILLTTLVDCQRGCDARCCRCLTSSLQQLQCYPFTPAHVVMPIHL